MVLIAAVWLTYSPYRRDLHQPQVDSNVGPLAQGQNLTQEFRSNIDNLARIDLFVGTYSRNSASLLVIELFSEPPDDASYRVSSTDTAALVDNAYFRWKFDPLPDSAGRNYVLSVWSPDATIDDSVTLWTSKAGAYPEGIAAINEVPRPSESLTFSTYSHVALDQLLVSSLAKAIPDQGGHLAILAALLGPGFVLWSLSRLRANILNDLPLVFALSLALSPTLLLWGVLSPARAVMAYWGFGPILLAVGLGVVFLRAIRDGVAVSWWSLLTVVTAFLTAATRLVLYDGQQYPFSGDSVHHVTAVELFRRDAGLPTSWNPIAQLDTFTVDFGFHVWASDLAHALDLTSRSVVVTFGFVLLGLTALSSAYLAERLCGRPIAGPIAALLTGFLMPFPSFLLNWGQYAQLFSLFMLAILVAISMETLTNELSWRQVPIYSLLLVGIFVGHFRTALLGATFVLALLVVTLVRRQHAVRLLSAIGLAAVLALPWLIRLLGRPSMLHSTFPTSTEWSTMYNAVGDVFFFTPAWALAAAGMGAVIIGLGHFARALVVLFWIGLSWGLASVGFANWPVGLSIDHFFLQSSAYAIVTPLAAVTATWIAEIVFVLISRATGGPNVAMGNRRANWGRPLPSDRESLGLILQPPVLPAMIAIILGLTVALSTNHAVAPDPRYRLVYEQDIKAMEWLREASGEPDKTLVMNDLVLGESTIVGTDAGWWLPLAGISTQLPPVVYLVERLAPVQSEWIELMVADHQMSRPLNPDRWVEHDFKYLYVGVANRWTNVNTTRPIKLVYDQEGVRIYDLQAQ